MQTVAQVRRGRALRSDGGSIFDPFRFTTPYGDSRARGALKPTATGAAPALRSLSVPKRPSRCDSQRENATTHRPVLAWRVRSPMIRARAAPKDRNMTGSTRSHP